MFAFKKLLLKRIALLLLAGALMGAFIALFVNVFSAAPPVIRTIQPPYYAPAKSYLERQIDKIRSVAPTEKFSFAVLSDSHVSPDNGGNTETLKNILADIEKGDYLFTIDVGDLVIGNTRNKPQYFYNIIKKERTPILTAPGNHDVEVDGGKNYLRVFGDFNYSFGYGNSFFIIFNDSDDRFIDDKQLSWLEQQLSRDYEHKFVFMHKPLSDPRPNNNHSLTEEHAVKISYLMEKYKPAIVFSGHIHAYYEWTAGGVTYITTGGAGGNKVGNDPDHNFHNYIKVDVEGDKISKEVIKIP